MKMFFPSLFILLLIFSLNACKEPEKLNNHSEIHQDLWTCSMHPQVQQNSPGKCPICSMDLIKVSKESTAQNIYDKSNYPSGHGMVKLTLEQKELIGVKTGYVEKKPLFKSIDTAARVAFDPELFSAENEFIEAIKQEVSVKNSPMNEIKQSAKAMVESSQMRLKILGLSDQQIKILRQSQLNNFNSNYLIPRQGDRIWIYAEVYEMDLTYIKPGLTAQISNQSLEGKKLNGKVISVDRVINPTTRSAKVRIALDDSSLHLRPESYVEVSILSPLGEQIVIPFDAVFDTGKEAWIFIVGKDQTIHPRKVVIKDFVGDEVALFSGASVGEKIVTSANFLIDSESRMVGTREELSAQTPTCPDGQKWHEQMKHCM